LKIYKNIKNEGFVCKSQFLFKKYAYTENSLRLLLRFQYLHMLLTNTHLNTYGQTKVQK
jgi:hypothetical protein